MPHRKAKSKAGKKAQNKRVSAKIRKLKAEGKSQKAAVGQALGMERGRAG